MKGLKQLLINDTENLQTYTNEEVVDILRKECELNGNNYQLTVCMEEFSELIEVIIENSITGKYDKIHLLEEIIDCQICVKYLTIIYGVEISEPISKMCNNYNNDKCIDNCALTLSKAIQRISKCIREKPNAEKHITTVIFDTHEVVLNLLNYYNINLVETTEYDIIFNLKIARCEKRNSEKITLKSDTVVCPENL